MDSHHYQDDRDSSIISLVAVVFIVMFAFIALTGCMTVKLDNVTLVGGSKLTIHADKTVTITTDASVPAGALGL